jgi:nucleoside-diphosphate-sugar epimerase
MIMATNELHVVFGATGGAGSAIVRELVRRGKRVRAVNRSGKTDIGSVEAVRADVLDAGSTRAAAEGATVVYNATNAPYTKWPELFPPMWQNVTEAAAHAGAKLVVVDNLYMYGTTNGSLTEDTPYRATGRKGMTRIKMAEQLMEAQRSGKVRVAVGRSADYFGPGITLSLFNDALFRKALAGKRVSGVANLDLPPTQAFIDDVGRGIVTLGEHDEAFGQIWHMPHAPAITQREFIRLIFNEAGQPPKIGRMSTWVFRLGGIAVPILRELAEMSYQYEQPFVVDSSKFERAFGVHPTPLPEAIRQTLDWVRQAEQIQPATAH